MASQTETRCGTTRTDSRVSIEFHPWALWGLWPVWWELYHGQKRIGITKPWESKPVLCGVTLEEYICFYMVSYGIGRSDSDTVCLSELQKIYCNWKTVFDRHSDRNLILALGIFYLVVVFRKFRTRGLRNSKIYNINMPCLIFPFPKSFYNDAYRRLYCNKPGARQTIYKHQRPTTVL
jgi:hypothetical protein